MVLAERDHALGSLGQLLVRDDPVAVEAGAPELARDPVAADVGAGQLLELLAAIDEAAGDRRGLGVREGEVGGEIGVGPRLPLG